MRKLSSKKIGTSRTKSDLRYPVFVAMLALSAILLLQSAYLVWHAHNEYHRGQQILAVNQATTPWRAPQDTRLTHWTRFRQETASSRKESTGSN